MRAFLYLIIFFLLFSCGKIAPKGNITSQEVKLNEFKNLDLDGKFRVFYVRGKSDFINIETYKNFADNLDIEVTNHTLKISEIRPVKNFDFYNITVYSRYALNSIKLSDSVEFNTSSEIKTDNFKLNLKNSAKFIGTIDSRRADLEMQDHSLANFRGKTQDASLKLSDSASIIAPYWFVDNVNILNENGSYAEINVKDTLKGNIKNTSKMLYYDDPIRAFRIEKSATVTNKKLN